jgi:flagellar basal body-associated protein FliL
VVIILILALGVVFLVIFRRRRQKMEQKQKLAEETARDIHPVEIEMQSEEPQIVVNKPPKKNIYVYDREVVQN